MEEHRLAYQFNELTGEYVGLRFAQFHAQQWLLPGSSTWEKPPDLAEHEVAVWDGKAWQVKADYRRILYWHKQTKQQFIIEEIDCYADADWTDQDPAKVDLNYTYFDEDKGRWVFDQAAKDRADAEQSARQASAYLRSTDWLVLRKVEKGTQIPVEVTATRDAARISIDLAEAVVPGIKDTLAGDL
jgi:hypothetical protein